MSDPLDEQNDKKSIDLGYNNKFLYIPKKEDLEKRLAKQ